MIEDQFYLSLQLEMALEIQSTFVNKLKEVKERLTSLWWEGLMCEAEEDEA